MRHSPVVGCAPEIHTRAGHFCADWMSRLFPAASPLLRHKASMAPRQSGAPFAAVSQRSRPETILVLGSRSIPVLFCASPGEAWDLPFQIVLTFATEPSIQRPIVPSKPSSCRGACGGAGGAVSDGAACSEDRKSTRLNSSHSQISYAVFCLKKK